LGVVTPKSRVSSYVMFELGASWGAVIPTFPLLAKGAKFSDLPGPLAEQNGLNLAQDSDIHKMLEDAVAKHGFKRRPGVAENLAVLIKRLSARARKRR